MSDVVQKPENTLMAALQEASKSREFNALEAKLFTAFEGLSESVYIPDSEKYEMTLAIESIIQKLRKL